MTRDYRDLCIEEATARILELEHNFVASREMLSIALSNQHTAQARIRQLEEQRDRLQDELRRLRAGLMQQPITPTAKRGAVSSTRPAPWLVSAKAPDAEAGGASV